MLGGDNAVVLAELRLADDGRAASSTALEHRGTASVFGHV
jgi:hypothetical protein